MNGYKKLLGMVVDNMVIDSIEPYYDFSTDRVEYAYGIQGQGIAINCDLFIEKYLS